MCFPNWYGRLPESLTDPSYEGQILVLTFPLIGNYGTPSRELVDSLPQLPTYFESNRIHISALVVAQYSPDFSHFLASSSIADWLKENNIPPFMVLILELLPKRLEPKVLCWVRLDSLKTPPL